MATVAIRYTAASLKADTIFIGGVEMGGGIEVLDLFWYKAQNGIAVEGHLTNRFSCRAVDAGAGNEMSLGGEILCRKDLITCFYHTGIVAIHIMYEDPSADTVVRQST